MTKGPQPLPLSAEVPLAFAAGLVSLAAVAVALGDAEALVEEALEHAQRGNSELRELAHGILPDVLTRNGLRAGIAAVVARELRVESPAGGGTRLVATLPIP
jgi:hypothetical protein